MTSVGKFAMKPTTRSQTQVGWEGTGSCGKGTCSAIAQWSFIEHPLYCRHCLAIGHFGECQLLGADSLAGANRLFQEAAGGAGRLEVSFFLEESRTHLHYLYLL